MSSRRGNPNSICWCFRGEWARAVQQKTQNTKALPTRFCTQNTLVHFDANWSTNHANNTSFSHSSFRKHFFFFVFINSTSLSLILLKINRNNNNIERAQYERAEKEWDCFHFVCCSCLVSILLGSMHLLFYHQLIKRVHCCGFSALNTCTYSLACTDLSFCYQRKHFFFMQFSISFNLHNKRKQNNDEYSYRKWIENEKLVSIAFLLFSTARMLKFTKSIYYSFFTAIYRFLLIFSCTYVKCTVTRLKSKSVRVENCKRDYEQMFKYKHGTKA